MIEREYIMYVLRNLTDDAMTVLKTFRFRGEALDYREEHLIPAEVWVDYVEPVTNEDLILDNSKPAYIVRIK